MKSAVISVSFLAVVNAARPYMIAPDTGAAQQYGTISAGGALPNVSTIIGLPDFQYVAEGYMNSSSYTYYHSGAAGEWSYRNSLEVFQRVRMRPRVMAQVNDIESSLPTTILGYNFSTPFFIAPCASAAYANESGEIGLVRGSAAGDILYVASDFSSTPKADMAAARSENQVMFQQLYIDPSNETATLAQIRQVEDLGLKAIILTADSPADGNRHRAERQGVGSADSSYSSMTWEYYSWFRNQTSLPVVLKGIQSVEDAVIAYNMGAPAIYLSNHGGRQLDTSPSALEVAVEIYEQAPYIYQGTMEVWADGGVRYGADVVKLLALGVKSVGVGRPFMFSNVYGEAGVERAVDILKREVAIDAANSGIGDLKQVNSSYIRWSGGLTNQWGL